MFFCRLGHIQVLALSMGEHVVKKGAGDPKEPPLFPQQAGSTAAVALSSTAVQLYQLLPGSLLYRAAHLGPVRSVSQRGLGALAAPYGHAAVVFMGVVGHGTLAAWDASVTAAAVALYQEAAQSLLYAHGGYLLEAVDGLCLAAFSRPAAAIRWSLDTVSACLAAQWPPQLLAHELGEEVVAMSLVPSEPLMLTPMGLVAAGSSAQNLGGGGAGGVLAHSAHGQGIGGASVGGAAVAGVAHTAHHGHPAHHHHTASAPHTPRKGHGPVGRGPSGGLAHAVGAAAAAGGGGSPGGGALHTPKPRSFIAQLAAAAGGKRGHANHGGGVGGGVNLGGARVTALHTTQVLLRGLRLRVGIDWGPVKAVGALQCALMRGFERLRECCDAVAQHV